jgi:hypothetical protein
MLDKSHNCAQSFCASLRVHPRVHSTSWVQLGSKCCQIRSKTLYHDAEQSQTDQQDRFFATALGAGGPLFKSARTDHLPLFSETNGARCGFREPGAAAPSAATTSYNSLSRYVDFSASRLKSPFRSRPGP